MIELKVYQGRDWINLDTYGNENVALTFQVDDVRNIANKNASYSKDFNLPATKRNNRFFEHYYDLDRYNLDFNAYKSFRCELYIDGINVLEGYLKLLGTLEKQTEISYRVVIFNDVANLIDSLGDANVENLDLSELEHFFEYNTIVASWFGTDQLGNEVPYSYGLVNSGNMYEDEGIFYVPHTNFVMNVKLKYIIDKIFQYAGFSYDSNFFDSDEFDRLYFTTASIKDYGTEIEPYEIVGSEIVPPLTSIGAGQSFHDCIVIGNGWDNQVVIPVENVANNTGEFDPANCTFTASTNLVADVTIKATAINATANYITLTCLLNGQSIGSYGIFQQPLLNTPQIQVLTFETSINLLQGQSFQVAFACDFVTNNFGIRSDDFKISIAISNASTQDLVQTQLAGVKLADIVKDTFTMFNLIASDKGNKQIKIEPYVSYISNKVVDWTNKVDINEIELETIEIPRRLVFKHAQDDEDYYLNTYFQDNGIEYGTHIVNFDVDNEEEEVIELKVFSVPFIKTLEGTDMTIQHVGILKDGENIEPYNNKPSIVFRRTSLTEPNTATTQYPLNPIEEFEDWQLGTDLTTYPQLTHFNQLIVDCASNDNSYLFGNINPNAMLDLPNLPVRNLFQRFWREYIEEKYNVDTRILKVKAKLSATDILNLDFSKTYQIADQYYRLNKVDYNTDKNKLTSLELIRI